MTPHAWITVAVVGGLIGLIALKKVAMDMAFLAALTVLVLTHVLTTQQAFAGFANESMLAIGVLYVMVAGLRETGAVSVLARRIFGRPTSEFNALLRVLLATTTISAWIYDNPLVAMLLPTVDAWAKRYRIPVSRLLMPLSYAALLGGPITLVGTSTNLIVDGLIRKSGMPGFTIFEFTPVGLLVAVAGIVTIVATSKWLLPNRNSPVAAAAQDIREYSAEVVVDPKGPLVGKTIEEAGLRNLPGSYVVEVDRGDERLIAVGPEFRLQGSDRLTLVGDVSSVIDYRRVNGLIPGGDQISKLSAHLPSRILIEAVVSKRCPLAGKSVRDGKFRTAYNAVIIAIARDGERIQGKIGDVVLRAGDTLLLEALPSFVEQQRNSRDFYLVSQIPDSRPPRHDRALIAILIIVGVISAATFGLTSLLTASLVGAGLMVVTRCVNVATARRSVDWTVLVVIACSFGLSTALDKTGAGGAISQSVLHIAGSSPVMSLISVYVLTTLFTEVLSHSASAAIMVPISLALARQLHVAPLPFAVAIVIATAIGFATPIAHQTNLMVFGPGGYKFSDFMRLGLLLDVVCGIVAVAAITVFFPF